MKPPFRLSALGPWTKALLGFVFVVTIVVALFDWNWFRRPLERYLFDKSDREVRIDDLHVKLGLTLEPTVRLRGLYIQNAPWAAKQPMVTAGEASFTFSLRSVWEDRPVISRLVLVDADVDIERQANGLRNWRLVNPDDRSPGRVRVRTLEAHRTKIRFVHRGIDFELVAAASPLEPAVASAQNQALTNKIDFKGRYRGERFAGVALTGEVLSIRDSGKSFPMRGHIASGKTRVDGDGTFTDIFDLAAMDAKVRIAGPTLSKLHPFVDFRPGVSGPFEAHAQVELRENDYTITRLRGKIGDTDLAGEARYNRNADRPSLQVALKSESADLADLGSLVGMNFPSDRSATKPAQISSGAKSAAEPQPTSSAVSYASGPERIFPQRAIHADGLRTFDARVTMDARKFYAAGMPALESLRLAADLIDGLLQIKTIDVGMAGGHALGSVTFDGRHQPPSARATIDLRDVRLEKLFPALPDTARSVGAVRAQIKMAGQGNSIAAILGNATGSLAAMIDGGRISNLLDAKLGLNRGKILGLLIRGDRAIALNCGAIAFEFRNGTGKSQTILLDTEQTRTDGIATINLRDEQFELLLTPEPKRPGLLTLRSSIGVQGSFKRAHFATDKRVALDRGGSAAAQSTLSALFGPLMETGRSRESQCAPFFAQTQRGRKAVVAKE